RHWRRGASGCCADHSRLTAPAAAGIIAPCRPDAGPTSAAERTTMLPKTYKKLVVVAPGPDFAAATRVVEVPLPAPGPTEILIRNRYAGVNASDPVFAAGGYGAAAAPFDVGIDSSGE